jgi:phosphatidylserine/phosphatidylglycerophosphate/cardiolipin synthase-like enzyme
MSNRQRQTTLIFLTVVFVAALIQGCLGDGSLWDVAEVPVPPAIQQDIAASSEWYELYLTEPSADRNRGGPDAALAAAMDRARVSIDIAAYDLNLWSLRNALIDAHRRGVQVRMVTETNNLDRREIGELQDAGIPILDDNREGLMHNKFVIIDREQVWTGSMNFTLNGAYRNDNNLIQIRSAELAQDYLVEFEEMFVDDQFGFVSPANTPNPRIVVDGTTIDVFFSPDDGVQNDLVELIYSAEESVHFLAFSFTADPLTDALLDIAEGGVVVRGIFDDGQVESNTGGDFATMRDAGLDVRRDGNEFKMHHKVIIIDGKIVAFGSYNFSRSAEVRNDENLLIIYNETLAQEFLDEFTRIYEQAGR